MAERIFTLEEAERLLPELEGWLRSAIENKKRIGEVESEYTELARSVAIQGGRLIDVPYWIARKRQEEEWAVQLRDAAQHIEECGCLVKDLDIGLIDFPCELEGREIYLCWKLGEASIAFWHGTDEGFAGRKPIDGPFREHFRRQRPM
ncbi:MAG: DUF2203 domain-containing protein [Acidobacteria bacterium]|nr:DUF2203 domain-containing protein [Acidobacteriota bacterium]